LDLEKFNYDDDLISMDEMTAIEDLNINSKWLTGPTVYLREQAKNSYSLNNIYTNLDDCITDSIYSIRSTLAGQKQNINGTNRERPLNDLVPILFAIIWTTLGKPKPRTSWILLDLSTSYFPERNANSSLVKET
jgi:hypothetical protein